MTTELGSLMRISLRLATSVDEIGFLEVPTSKEVQPDNIFHSLRFDYSLVFTRPAESGRASSVCMATAEPPSTSFVSSSIA